MYSVAKLSAWWPGVLFDFSWTVYWVIWIQLKDDLTQAELSTDEMSV